jgi:hypothetical protein
MESVPNNNTTWRHLRHHVNKFVFLPQDENKSFIYRENLNYLFIIYILLLWHYNLKDFPLNFVIWQNLEEKKRVLARHQWKKRNISSQWNIFFSQWKYGKWKTHFISSIFLNILKYIIKFYTTRSINSVLNLHLFNLMFTIRRMLSQHVTLVKQEVNFLLTSIGVNQFQH